MIQWTAKFDNDDEIYLEVEGGYVESEKWEVYADWVVGFNHDSFKITGAACYLDPEISLWTEPDGNPKKCVICLCFSDDGSIFKEFQARVMSMIRDPNKDKIRWAFEIEEQE
jgi:hypothetical protein